MAVEKVGNPRQLVGGQPQAVLRDEGSHVDVTLVDGVAVVQCGVAVGHGAPFGIDRQQNTGLLVALADRCDHEAFVALTIGFVDLATGEDVHPTGEDGGVGAAQHEHFEPLAAVAQQHHRRRGLHRHYVRHGAPVPGEPGLPASGANTT